MKKAFIKIMQPSAKRKRAFLTMYVTLFAVAAVAFLVWRTASNGEPMYEFMIIASVVLSIAAIFTFLILRPNSFYNDVEKIEAMISNISENKQEQPVSVHPKSVLYHSYAQLCDIETNLQNNIDKALRSEKTKVELITNVSHDLRTPLTSIIGNIEVMKSMTLPPELQERVELIYAKSVNLNDMLSDVFEISKAASGTIRLNKMEFDVKKMVEQTLAELNDRIIEFGAVMKLSFCDENLFVHNDNERLHRVFQNLIDNAIQYSLSGTRIYIDVQKKNDAAVVSVVNTASYEMNFSAEEITARFVRGEPSRIGEGSGLGLAIAKTFTEACGGEFDVRIKGDQFETVVCLPLISTEN